MDAVDADVDASDAFVVAVAADAATAAALITKAHLEAEHRWIMCQRCERLNRYKHYL